MCAGLRTDDVRQRVSRLTNDASGGLSGGSCANNLFAFPQWQKAVLA